MGHLADAWGVTQPEPATIETLAEKERREWLEWRRQGIGGSDIAAIVGLAPDRWSSPYSVWADKVGLTPLDDRDGQSEAMEYGQRAEAMIADWFHDKTGLHVGWRSQRWIAPDRPWMRATLDGLALEVAATVDPADALGVVEVKTTRDSPKAWEEGGIPLYYRCQAQWQMAVTGLPRAWFAVLHGHQFRVYPLERDDDDIAYLTEQASEFWHGHVLTGNPPTVDGSKATTTALAQSFNRPSRIEVDLDDDTAKLVRLYAAEKTAAKIQKARVDELANNLKLALGLAGGTDGLVDGQTVVTWRAADITRLDGKRHRKEQAACHNRYSTTTTQRRLVVAGLDEDED